jgi:hypothetical protein
MGLPWLSLRVLHLVLGTFWVGTDAFLTFLLIPRLRVLGPNIERSVMGVLMHALPPVLMVSSLLTAATGIWMVTTLQGWDPGSLLANGWGLCMLVGLIGTFVSRVIGMGLLPPITIRYQTLIRRIEAQPATAEETSELQRLADRTTMLARINSVLLIIVVIAMAVARYA